MVSTLKEKILVVVKTYPVLSRKYGELVCTAGVLESGQWIRIYPVPFRLLNDHKKYKKYQWIQISLIRNKDDKRPESFKIQDERNLQPLETISTEGKWKERKKESNSKK